jgi:hypothetical protein
VLGDLVTSDQERDAAFEEWSSTQPTWSPASAWNAAWAAQEKRYTREAREDSKELEAAHGEIIARGQEIANLRKAEFDRA